MARQEEQNKKKLSIEKIAYNKTGGGPRFSPSITESEEKFLEIIKPVAIEGDTSVQESYVEDIFGSDDGRLELIYEESDAECSSSVYNTLDEKSCENITPNIPFKESSSGTHIRKNISMTSAAPHKLEDQSVPKRKSKANEISTAVNHFKTITVEENDIKKSYYREKLEKLERIIGFKERKCKALERLADAVEQLSS